MISKQARRTSKYSPIDGDTWRSLRVTAGLTQHRVAAGARIYPSVLSNIERGATPVTHRISERLIESLTSLGVDVSHLKNEPVENFWTHQEKTQAANKT